MIKDVRQGKSFQKCTIFCTAVYCLCGYVNTRRMSKPDMGSIIHIKNQWKILVIGNYYVNYQNYQNLMLLTSSDTKRTLRHLLLFTNSAQLENWFQDERRVYATAISFPCISTLSQLPRDNFPNSNFPNSQFPQSLISPAETSSTIISRALNAAQLG